MPGSSLFRRERRSAPINWRLFQTRWIDPFPEVPGTLPEKMVVAELAKRNVQFIFQADFSQHVLSQFPPAYRTVMLSEGYLDIRTDILLPLYKVAIEVQGEYWHSIPEGIARDEQKGRIYTALEMILGWQVYWLWEDDILADVVGQVDRITQIPAHPEFEGKWVIGDVRDDTAGLASRNRKRARPRVGLSYRRPR